MLLSAVIIKLRVKSVLLFLKGRYRFIDISHRFLLLFTVTSRKYIKEVEPYLKNLKFYQDTRITEKKLYRLVTRNNHLSS